MDGLFDISGKVVVITGGSRGIGEMIAEGMTSSGARTFVVARDQEKLEAVENRLSGVGACTAIPADLATVGGIAEFVDVLGSHVDHVDILINNAGNSWAEPFAEFKEKGWDRVMDLNLKSPFFLSQRLLPLLERNATSEAPARIINIASVNAYINSVVENYPYTATKAAVIGLTRHMAAKLVKSNILVNGIAPGLFYSDMTAFAIDGREESAAASVPRGRMGSVEDITGAVTFLSSRAGAWMCGHTLVLDGGQLAAAR